MSSVYTASVDELLEAIRTSCSARVWSSGVRLAREDAVSGESAGDDEIVVRVKTPERAVAPTVVLYPEDCEWDCDCPSSQATCVHVVAAAIAVSQARKQGEALPSSTSAGGAVEYRFMRQDGGLALDRYIIGPGGEHRLQSTLSALMAGRDTGPEVAAEQADLNTDRILGMRVRGVIPNSTLVNILTALADNPRVKLDGVPITISRDRVLPRAEVVSRSGHARVTISRDPRITEVVTGGVVLCGRDLHLLGEIGLTGSMLERLPQVLHFERSELGDLYSNVLPDLERRIEVERRIDEQPDITGELRPRVHFQIDQDGRRMSVLPTLVYGDPACARIDGDHMVHLQGPVPVRDRAAEKRVLARLRDALDLAPGRTVFYENQDAVRFTQRYRAYQGRAQGANAKQEGPRVFQLEPRLVVRGDDGDFELYFELMGHEPRDGASADRGANADAAGQSQRVDADRVVRAWRDGVELMLLPGSDASMAQLPADWLARFGHVVADLLAAKGERERLPRHALFDLARLCEDLDQPPPPGLHTLAPLIEGFERLPAPTLPADLSAALRPYQRVGVSWLQFLRDAGLGAMLADDMGLGKTLQALCAVGGRALVVCPTSVIYNWADEAARFRPSLRVCVYHGPKRQLSDDADLVLTSYALLRLDIERLADIRWSMVILDEAQAIKNPDSQAARAAYRLQADFRLTMSGTPVENRLDELWSQMHFANPGLLGGRQSFKERYADAIARGDNEAAERLRTRIRPFLLRRRKQDVAPELPPRTDAVMHCELDEREREIYDAVLATTRKDVLARLAQGGGVMAALEALLRLRQAACHPALLPGQGALEDQPSSKISALIDALELVSAEDHKALVFSQWTSLLDLIEPWLRRSGIDWVRLDGATRDRASVVRAFQSQDGPPVMLISLKAGGTGLNLTAADHVFLCDPWWNPAVEDQAADRAHRIGQDQPVLVYRMVARDTVEERILALQERKRTLAATALEGADAAAGLTREDLMALLA